MGALFSNCRPRTENKGTPYKSTKDELKPLKTQTYSNAHGQVIQVFAVDFGSSFSCYAFSKIDSKDISLNRSWEMDNGTRMLKTPTCALFNTKKELVDFGYKALLKYTKEPKFTRNGFFYHHFRNIECKDISSINSEQNVEKEHLIKATFVYFLTKLADQLKLDFTKESMIWVLPLKSTENDSIKRASEADIENDSIKRAAEAATENDSIKRAAEAAAKELKLLVTIHQPREYEVAALYCQNYIIAERGTEEPLPDNTKYAVVDFGAGHITSSIHKKTGKSTMEMINKKVIDIQHFRNLLIQPPDTLIGDYKKRHPEDWLEMVTGFERGLGRYNLGDKKPFDFSCPATFTSFVNEFEKRGNTYFNVFESSLISVKKNRVYIEYDDIFEEPVNESIRYINSKVEDKFYKKDPVQYIFVVGGLSRIIFPLMKKEFPNLKVIHPEDPDACLVKGAVMYGIDEIQKSFRNPTSKRAKSFRRSPPSKVSNIRKSKSLKR